MESVDQKVLKELIGKRFPVEDFETELEKIMKKKSGAKLLISNRPDTIKGTDGKYHAVNYKCVPQSKSCKYLFCFMLKYENGMVWIKNGYLEKL